MYTLIEFLKKVKDERRAAGQRHPLWFILLIVILGLMTGHLGYRALGDFAKIHQKTLTEYFHFPKQRVPSYSTIRRAIQRIDWADLIQVFNEWSDSLYRNDTTISWLSIDGKSLNATVSNFCTNRQDFVSLVSIFCSENGLTSRLGKYQNKKTSEIRCVRELVKTSGLKNKTFTLDALHCQKETVELIVETENDYLIAVKKNQPRLYNHLTSLAKTDSPLTQHIDKEKSHGREITRKVSVFKAPEDVQAAWKNSQVFVRVERKGRRGGDFYSETAYYLSSRTEEARVLAEQIQRHWRIENQLHWVKDVIFKEDNWPLSHFQAATNFSVLRTLAVNLLRFLGFFSITEAQRWLTSRVDKLLILLE